MNREAWIRIGMTLILTIISIVIILNISADNMTDYIVAAMIGFMIIRSAIPDERPGLIGDRIAIGVILFAPIVAIYFVMPLGAIFSYLIGILITLLLSKRKVYSY